MDDDPSDGAAEQTRGRRAGSLRSQWGSLRSTVREDGLRRIARGLYGVFMDNNLLTYASAIGFQVLFALITLTFTALALLGFLSLTEVWEQDLAPEVAERTSTAAFTVIDTTVDRVLTRQQGFWLTLGAALALWNVSSGVRAVMGALDDIYGAERSRPLWQRMAVSLALAVPVSLLLIGAVACAQVAPRMVRSLDPGTVGATIGRVVGWAVAIVLLSMVVWLLVRFAPSVRQPASIVSVAAILVVGFWLVASIGFGFYATTIASYGSVFGNLAFGFVLLVYISISSLAFLAGVQTDAYLRGIRAEPDRAPTPRGG